MNIDASQLRIALEEGEAWRRTMSVTVPGRVVEAEREKAAAKLAKRLNLPGFRKGKIPADLVEKRYGQALRRETLDKVIGEAYREALRTESLRPISEGEVEDVEYEPDGDLRFAISFDVSPEVTVGRLGGFSLQRPRAQVMEEDVEKVLRRLREQNGDWRAVEEGKPEEGDLVSVELVRLDAPEEGEGAEPRGYELVLGEGDAIPDVENAILTLEPGAEGEFEIRFPDDFPNEERRGEHHRLLVRLLERKVRDLPPLDDAFASAVGEFENLEALRSAIREDLAQEAEKEAESAVRAQLVDRLLEANRFAVPRSMVDRYLDELLGDTEGAEPEQVEEARERLRPRAERAVKRILLIDRIADSQGLRATEEELDERVQSVAERNDTNPARVYANLRKSGRLEQLQQQITEDKVFEFLKGESEIAEAAESAST